MTLMRFGRETYDEGIQFPASCAKWRFVQETIASFCLSKNYTMFLTRSLTVLFRPLLGVQNFLSAGRKAPFCIVSESFVRRSIHQYTISEGILSAPSLKRIRRFCVNVLVTQLGNKIVGRKLEMHLKTKVEDRVGDLKSTVSSK